VVGRRWTRFVERWTVAVTGDGAVPVGDARVIVLNLSDGVQVVDLVDAATGTWREPPATAGQRRAGADSPGDGTAAVLGAHVLVLDRIFVEPPARGWGLGPVVAAVVTGRLGRGCGVAVCFPAPFDGPRPDDERDRAIDALGAIWAKVGFRSRPDGVWTLDLAGDRLAVTTAALLAAVGTTVTEGRGPSGGHADQPASGASS